LDLYHKQKDSFHKKSEPIGSLFLFGIPFCIFRTDVLRSPIAVQAEEDSDGIFSIPRATFFVQSDTLHTKYVYFYPTMLYSRMRPELIHLITRLLKKNQADTVTGISTVNSSEKSNRTESKTEYAEQTLR
jgi:hypothetical protein